MVLCFPIRQLSEYDPTDEIPMVKSQMTNNTQITKFKITNFPGYKNEVLRAVG